MKLATAKVHFIGIGGIGMCGLAELLHNMGAQVTGSDMGENAQTTRLKKMGIPVFKGHSPENIKEAEVVVFSSAVKEDNPEYQESRRRRIPLIRRAEALAEIMLLKRGIAIGGTHGKTTTTSLTASAFLAAKEDPTICVGGRLDLIQSTAQLGQGEWLIAEADESDGSFSRLSPEIVVITNIDDDHLDHYGSFERLQEAFFDFALRIPFYGSAIVCGDDPRVRELFRSFPKKILFYGKDVSNDYVLSRDNGAYALVSEGKTIGHFSLPMPGIHNALNATAAFVAGLEAGLKFEDMKAGIENFRGVDRRFQHKGFVSGIDFYDDYGHHPTEIRAVLSGFKEKFRDRRKVVVFQPHRYSRSQLLWEDFCHSFKDADEVFVLDIYPAGEKPIENIDSERMVREMDHPSVRYLNRKEDPELKGLEDFLKAGDVVVSLGAGDVYRLVEAVHERMAKARGSGT